MPSKIILKKSSVATKAPVAGDLDFGELAINYTDSKLYFKKADGSIDAFAASAPVTSVGGNVGDITNAQLLTSIKNVDGANSGLDADFLDGLNASAFYLASNPNGYTNNTGTVTSVATSGTVSGLTLTGGTITTSGTITLGGTLSVTPSNFASQTAGTVLAAPSGVAGVPTFRALVAADIPILNQDTTGSASLIAGLSIQNLYNNMGQNHNLRTSFDARIPSYSFGYRFVQGSTNGPGTGGSQYYSWYIGLGNEYPATGTGSYGAMFAVDRNVTTPYLSVRYNEGNLFSAWRRIAAGYADIAGRANSVNPANTYTAVLFNSTSDEILKTNWRNLPGNFVDLLALVKSGTYDRIDQELTQDGVSAQSLQPLLPNSVFTGEDGKLSVAYGNAALVSAVELAKRVVEQDARIAKLEERLSKLLDAYHIIKATSKVS